MPELEKAPIRLHKGDKDPIDELFPAARHNRVIRTLVHKLVIQQRTRATAAFDRLPEVDPNDLEDLA